MHNRSFLLAGLCVLMAIYAFSVTMIGPLLPSLISRYALSLSQGGLLESARSLGGVVAAIIGGVVLDRTSKRAMVTIGFAAYALSLWFVRFDPQFLVLLTLFFFIGASTRLVDTVSNALTADLFPERSGTALNLLHTMFGVGALAGPIYARIVLTGGGGWRSAFGILSVIGLGGLAAFGVVSRLSGRNEMPVPVVGPDTGAPDGPATAGEAPSAGGLPGGGSSAGGRRGRWPSAGQPPREGPETAFALLRRGPVVLVVLVMFLYSGSQAGLTVWLPTYAIERLHATSDSGAAMVSLMWAGIILSRIVNSRLVRRVNARTIIAVGLALSTLTTGIGVVSQSALVLMVAMFFTGLTTGATIPLLVSVACSLAPRATGAASSLVFLTGSLSRIVLPWSMGALAELVSFGAGMAVAWVVLPAALIPALVLVRAETN